jgi:hypothetical protein
MPCYVLSPLAGMFEFLKGYLHFVAKEKNIFVKIFVPEVVFWIEKAS